MSQEREEQPYEDNGTDESIGLEIGTETPD